MREPMDRDQMHDYVVAHGYGAPTAAGWALADTLWAQGDDYATIAHEMVFRRLTEGS